jgi:hypothetical protein
MFGARSEAPQERFISAPDNTYGKQRHIEELVAAINTVHRTPGRILKTRPIFWSKKVVYRISSL